MNKELHQPGFDDGALYLSHADFATPEDDGVFHGFFGRQGGESTGIYADLNCGSGSGDDPDAVRTNRALVAGAVGCDPMKLLNLHQIHSATAITVSEPWFVYDRPQADGMATDKAGLALAILTADCAPVLVCGRKADGEPVVGAAHAGWSGALNGILGSTVAQMKALGALPESLKAVIGPCIGPESYEVTEAFAEPFLAEAEDNKRFFRASRKPGHLMFDLPGYCAAKLFRNGVAEVFVKDLDTYFNEEDFFSYRRTTHRKDVDYGRQISVIMINK